MLGKPGSGGARPNRPVRRKTQESTEDLIRQHGRVPANKKCADCSTKMPQCVNTTVGTYICLTCSGIHRELNMRVKGIAASSFTIEEVERMQSTDNDKVNAVFLAKYNPAVDRLTPPVDNRDEAYLRQWLRRKYQEKAWYQPESQQPTIAAIPSKSQPTAPPADLLGFAADATAPVENNWDAFGGSSQNVPAAFPANFGSNSSSNGNAFPADFGSTQNADFANFGQRQQQAPVTQQQNNFANFGQPQAPPQQQQFANFGDPPPQQAPPQQQQFANFSGHPQVTTAPQQAPPQQQQFANFGGQQPQAPAPPQHAPSQQQQFANFGDQQPQAPVPTQQNPPQQQQFANFGGQQPQAPTPPQLAPPQQQQFANFGGQQPQAPGPTQQNPPQQQQQFANFGGQQPQAPTPPQIAPPPQQQFANFGGQQPLAPIPPQQAPPQQQQFVNFGGQPQGIAVPQQAPLQPQQYPNFGGQQTQPPAPGQQQQFANFGGQQPQALAPPQQVPPQQQQFANFAGQPQVTAPSQQVPPQQQQFANFAGQPVHSQQVTPPHQQQQQQQQQQFGNFAPPLAPPPPPPQQQYGEQSGTGQSMSPAPTPQMQPQLPAFATSQETQQDSAFATNVDSNHGQITMGPPQHHHSSAQMPLGHPEPQGAGWAGDGSGRASVIEDAFANMSTELDNTNVDDPPAPPTAPKLEVSKYRSGETVVYRNSSGEVFTCTILKVHFDHELDPFYTITLPDGREKQTDDGHLTLGDSSVSSQIVDMLPGFSPQQLQDILAFMTKIKDVPQANESSGTRPTGIPSTMNGVPDRMPDVGHPPAPSMLPVPPPLPPIADQPPVQSMPSVQAHSDNNGMGGVPSPTLTNQAGPQHQMLQHGVPPPPVYQPQALQQMSHQQFNQQYAQAPPQQQMQQQYMQQPPQQQMQQQYMQQPQNQMQPQYIQQVPPVPGQGAPLSPKGNPFDMY